MRVNVYAEEMTDRIEIIAKEIDGHKFTGLRFYLALPATLPDGTNYAAPFIHRPGDDDSAAVTFWGKRDLREVLRLAMAALDAHYDQPAAASRVIEDNLHTMETKPISEWTAPDSPDARCPSCGLYLHGDGPHDKCAPDVAALIAQAKAAARDSMNESNREYHSNVAAALEAMARELEQQAIIIAHSVAKTRLIEAEAALEAMALERDRATDDAARGWQVADEAQAAAAASAKDAERLRELLRRFADEAYSMQDIIDARAALAAQKGEPHD